MADLGTLIMKVNANTKGIEEGLTRTQKTLKGFKTATLAVAAGIAAVATSAIVLATKASETTDRIDKMSQRLGLSRQGFQEWEFVLSQAGTSIDTVQIGMKTLSQRMNEANEGAGKGADIFKQLGIRITESMTQEEAFNVTIKALQNMEDGVKKAALAQELFGRTGQELLPLLNSTAKSTEELKNKAQELGLILGDDAINAGVMFTDQMDQIKRAMGAVITTIGADLIPIFSRLVKFITTNMPLIQRIVGTAFGIIEKVVVLVTESLAKGIEIIIKYKNVLIPLVSGLAVLTIGIGIYNIALNATTIATTIATAATASFGAVLAFVTSPIGLVVIAIAALVAIGVALFRNWEEIQKTAKEVFENVKNIIVGVLDVIKRVIQSHIDAWKRVFDVIGNAINKIKEFFGLSSKSGGFEVNVNQSRGGRNISGQRAFGGPVTAGKSFLVGERGPEVFTPSTSGTVSTNSGKSVVININGATDTNTIMNEVVRVLSMQGITR